MYALDAASIYIECVIVKYFDIIISIMFTVTYGHFDLPPGYISAAIPPVLLPGAVLRERHPFRPTECQTARKTLYYRPAG